jgi:hypothetical protein
MSDFLFSSRPDDASSLEAALHGLYSSNRKVALFSGFWGSLAVTCTSNGELPIAEQEQTLTVLLEHPRPLFSGAHFGQPTHRLVDAVGARWKSQRMRWLSDLDGPFAAIQIDRRGGVVRFVTDIMQFVPLYQSSRSGHLAIGTHCDALARAVGVDSERDPVSIADFLAWKRVTFPYTVYRGIFQCSPATEYMWRSGEQDPRASAYWSPGEHSGSVSFDEAAVEVRNAVADHIAYRARSASTIAHFLSGGEDSRVIAGLLPKSDSRQAILFVDSHNREAQIAERVAERSGSNLSIIYRPPLHPVKIVENSSYLIGSAGSASDVYSADLFSDANLVDFDVVFGGLFFDLFLKGLTVAQRRRFLYNRRLVSYVAEHRPPSVGISANKYVSAEITAELERRRKRHIDYISSTGALEPFRWFDMFPMSMRSPTNAYNFNRRMFRSSEPVMSTRLVRMLPSLPSDWLLNRRLFHAAFQSDLKYSQWIRHADGRLPYYSWGVNAPLYFATKAVRSSAKRIRRVLGRPINHEGPWAARTFAQDSDYLRSLHDIASGLADRDPFGHGIRLGDFLLDPNLTVDRLRAIQLLYIFREISGPQFRQMF